jgi:hypothetical protein
MLTTDVLFHNDSFSIHHLMLSQSFTSAYYELHSLWMFADFESFLSHVEEKKVVFCINANGTEDFILNGLLAEGLMPHRLPKVCIQHIRTGRQHSRQCSEETF